MELLVLMFVTGFALATLIFWPLLHRANRRLGEQESAPRGKHALRAPTPPTVTRRTPEPTAAAEPAEPAESAEAAESTEAEAEQPAAEVQAVAPAQRTSEPVELPELPTDLYEKHFEAKFNRSRQRIARLRAEISKE
ncbi:hypothetical protein OU415_20595 [Saccharopolyspora sp. WRP15-2]|uniref:Uncharacterized protein n=1 Tax=Saccharopolyspora oryzae TaxID=2997343 RepID=A0ABT4V1M3_9PSEU|nr:hypothetical protein [Saccharopolyspora oryzae]MDA3627847.1 hypothetical protein [Saccharopolyspora oryzae]